MSYLGDIRRRKIHNHTRGLLCSWNAKALLIFYHVLNSIGDVSRFEPSTCCGQSARVDEKKIRYTMPAYNS